MANALDFHPEKIPVADFPFPAGSAVRGLALSAVVDRGGFVFLACCTRHEAEGTASGYYAQRDKGRLLGAYEVAGNAPQDCGRDAEIVSLTESDVGTTLACGCEVERGNVPCVYHVSNNERRPRAMASLSAHLQGKLAGLDARWSEPAPSLPPPARPPVPKSRTPAAPDHKSVTLVNGEGFSFKGLPHRLKLTGDQTPSFTRDGFGRWLRLPRGAGVDAITALYAREGLAWLNADGESGPPRLRSTEERLGLPGSRVRYGARDLGERTARCYPSRSLVILHWATFGLAVTLIDYVTTGQLVHLATGNTKRDRQWWRLMSRFCPSTAEMEDRLSAAWSRAWTGGVAASGTQPGNY